MPPHPHPDTLSAARSRVTSSAATRVRTGATTRLAAARRLPAPPRSTRRVPAPSAAAPPRRGLARARCASGQASVELVATLPVVLLILAFGWQAVLAGQAIWHARVAARAAARAHSFGADAEHAARAHLPRSLEPGLRVTTHASGDVRVSIRVPSVLPSLGLGRVGATSHFRPQT
jgi:hypothetical protein